VQTKKRKRVRMFERKTLEQYRALGREIAGLESDLGKRRTVADTVRASGKEPPYLAHTVLIVGDDQCIRDKLERRLRKAKRQRADIEAFVDTIEDSQTRQIIRLRYIKGMTWEGVAKFLGYATSDSVRMTAMRYMQSD